MQGGIKHSPSYTPSTYGVLVYVHVCVFIWCRGVCVCVHVGASMCVYDVWVCMYWHVERSCGYLL